MTNKVTGIANTNAVFTGLTNGVVWHFALTAVASNGIQSDYSEEAVVDWRKPSAPKGAVIKSMTLTLDLVP